MGRRKRKQTKTGFNLQQLTDIYVQELMPYLKRTSDDVLVRIDTHHARVMRSMGIGVDAFGQPLLPTARQENLAKELFGERVIDIAPILWYNAQAMLMSEKMPHEWNAIPFDSRAEWMAAKRIEGMVKTLERYREIMERRRKQALGAPNKGKTNRRKR